MTFGAKNFGEICAILVHDEPGVGGDFPEECWVSIIENVHAVDVRHWVKCNKVTGINHYCHMDEIVQRRGAAVANALRRKWDEARYLPGNDTVPCTSPLTTPQPVFPAPMDAHSGSQNGKEKSNYDSDITLSLVTGILMVVILLFIAVVWYCRRRERITNNDLNRYIAVRGPEEKGLA